LLKQVKKDLSHLVLGLFPGITDFDWLSDSNVEIPILAASRCGEGLRRLLGVVIAVSPARERGTPGIAYDRCS
jgi:hypothetical protein